MPCTKICTDEDVPAVHKVSAHPLPATPKMPVAVPRWPTCEDDFVYTRPANKKPVYDDWHVAYNGGHGHGSFHDHKYYPVDDSFVHYNGPVCYPENDRYYPHGHYYHSHPVNHGHYYRRPEYRISYEDSYPRHSHYIESYSKPHPVYDHAHYSADHAHFDEHAHVRNATPVYESDYRTYRKPVKTPVGESRAPAPTRVHAKADECNDDTVVYHTDHRHHHGGYPHHHSKNRYVVHKHPYVENDWHSHVVTEETSRPEPAPVDNCGHTHKATAYVDGGFTKDEHNAAHYRSHYEDYAAPSDDCAPTVRRTTYYSVPQVRTKYYRLRKAYAYDPCGFPDPCGPC